MSLAKDVARLRAAVAQEPKDWAAIRAVTTGYSTQARTKAQHDAVQDLREVGPSTHFGILSETLYGAFGCKIRFGGYPTRPAPIMLAVLGVKTTDPLMGKPRMSTDDDYLARAVLQFLYAAAAILLLRRLARS